MGFAAILELISKVIDFIPNKTKEQQAILAIELQKAQVEAELLSKQIDVNIASASNPSLWVSGARPFILWMCGMFFAWQYVVQPILIFFIVLCGFPAPILPIFDTYLIMTVLTGMLGIAGMRSYDKMKGTDK